MGIAFGLVAGIIALITGAITTSVNNDKAAEREREARKENFEYNEIAAENADVRTRNLYTDFESPVAQVQQLKEAGLSPSLFYSSNGSMGGASATGAMGQGASGVSPNTFGMGAPSDLADMTLKYAEANKAQAEADRLSGDNNRGKEEIENIIADTMGKKALAAYNNIMKEGAEIQNAINTETFEDQVSFIHYKSENMRYSAEKMMYDAISADAFSKVNKETILPKIAQEREKVKLLQADVLFRNSSIKLNEAEVKRINAEVEKWQEELLQGWLDLQIDQQNAQTNEKNAYTQEKYQAAVEKFQDAQVTNLKERLKMDEDHFTRKQRLEYIKIVTSLVDNGLGRGSELIGKVLPYAFE